MDRWRGDWSIGEGIQVEMGQEGTRAVLGQIEGYAARLRTFKPTRGVCGKIGDVRADYGGMRQDWRCSSRLRVLDG